ncbi:unnamed protein product, partial [Heterotrigona itama]
DFECDDAHEDIDPRQIQCTPTPRETVSGVTGEIAMELMACLKPRSGHAAATARVPVRFISVPCSLATYMYLGHETVNGIKAS